MLKVLWEKLNDVIKANPFTAFLVVVSALGVAMGKIADRVYNAEKYAKKALDKTAEKVNETKSEIESLNSELQTTQNRIDELNAKENLTLVEQEELERLKETNEELERELRIKQSILSEEQKEANKDAKKYFTTKKDSLEFESSYEGVEIHEKTDYIGTVEERIEKLQQYADGQIKLSEETIEAYKDYVESAISDFMEEDDYLIEGQDDGLLERLDALYEKFDIYTNGKAHIIEDRLKDILAKADFQSTSKQLEELGKSGELSVATLSSRFPELIEYLEKAGISAEELYQYIMALSNPDALNYPEIERQFRESLGIRDGEINGASDQKKWDEIKDSFSEDEWQIALEAYLKVKDQYGEHPEGWNAKDWISHIQSELETELIEIDTQLSISETIEQLNTRLKPAFDSLKSAYQDIFTDNGFTLENVGVDMLNSIKSTIDELNSMEGVDINIDSSAFEEFARVLSDTSSTAEDVQNQFDQLSNTIVRATSCTEVNSETFDVLTKSLEEMGLVNAREVLEEIIQAQEEFQAVSEQLGLTLEEVANATYEETVQMLIEAQAAGQDTQALWQLAVAQGTITDGTIATESNVDALLAEAQAAGLDAAMLTALENVRNGNIKDTNAAQAILEQTRQELQASMSSFKLDFDFSPAVKSAGKAGKDSGKSYKDALKEELSDLDSVISGITSRIDDNISSINSQKSVALESIDVQKEALEEAKEAAIEALEAERDAQLAIIEEQKKALENQIKQKQDEIDKINEAADAKRRENELMLAQYNLEKMMNQRTKLVK